MRRFAHLFLLLAAALLPTFFSVQAPADSLSVTPIPVKLGKNSPTDAITLLNNGQMPVVIQVDLQSWTQREGEDIYEPSRDLLVNPPIFTLPPGQSQIVRLGLHRPVDPQRELAYRLYLQEVPPPPQPGFTGLQIALRLGIPVFAAPAAPYNKALKWHAVRTRGGDVRVALDNVGNAHVHVFEIKLSQPDDSERILYTHQAHAYVLAGQFHSWTLQPKSGPWTGSRVQISALTDRGVVNAELPLERE